MSKEFSDALRRVLDMDPVATGVAAEFSGMSSEDADQVHQFQSNTQAAQRAPDRLTQFDHLLQTPGTDMVLQVAHEGARCLPGSGWIIEALIAPGHDGQITSYQYEEGGLEVGPKVDTARIIEQYSQYGSASLSAFFDSENARIHSAGYERPDYPFKDKEPHRRMGTNYLGLGFDRLDIIELNNGGRVLSEKIPRRSNLFLGIDTSDLTNVSNRAHSSYVAINRITDSPDELVAIAGHLATGMGLASQDAVTFVDHSVRKVM